MALLLDPATREALLLRIRFYRDLGLTEFYRRPVDPSQKANLGAPSSPLLSAERVGDYEPGSPKGPSAPGLVRRGGETADSSAPPEIANPKRARRATPAENDLALARAKAKRPAQGKTSSEPGPRKKKTWLP